MAYSNICDLRLYIVACYHSCSKCKKGTIYYSTFEQHNCISFKEKYYKFRVDYNNCYSIEENIKIWYFDEINSKFDICIETCSVHS